MKQLRELVQQHRRKRYHALVDRIAELREALRGIDPDVHPDVWQAVADDLQRQTSKADRLIDKLDYRLPKEL